MRLATSCSMRRLEDSGSDVSHTHGRCLAADAVDERNTAFPTVALLLLAGKHLAVEVEVGVVELMAVPTWDPMITWTRATV